MATWPIVLYQSKFQLAKSHITIAPSQYQVTKNPASGKKERVFVDLRAIYPCPEEPGTELSFEEIWAANRGWLGQTWEDDGLVGVHYPANDENNPPLVPTSGIDAKLVMHDVVTLDENGRLPDHHRGSKKKKMMEANETQISKFVLSSDMMQRSNLKQSRRSWTHRQVPRNRRGSGDLSQL